MTKFSAAVLTVSDRAASGKRPDATGPKLVERLRSINFRVNHTETVPDVRAAIVTVLEKWIREDGIHLILVTGGTGLAERDVTPEATLEVIERRVPGMEEAMRAASLMTTPHAMLSRAVAGTAAKSLIVNLPGSPTGALENLQVIEPALDHALKIIAGERPDP
jgi:molybdopterin adenylyltransferase